jgi:acyl-CoA hydrolase
MLTNAKAQTPAYTYAQMTQVVMPQNTNIHGTVFGGEIMSWMDICAGVSAQRHCRMPVVTASFDDVHFVIPIRHGYVVIIESQINAVFKSSMEIGITVTAENPETGERKVAVQAYCTFVSIDSAGRPQPVPPLITENPAEKKREQAAYARRKRRLEHRELEARALAASLK